MVQDNKLCVFYNEPEKQNVYETHYCLVVGIESLLQLLQLVQSLLNVFMAVLDKLESGNAPLTQIGTILKPDNLLG